MTINAGKELLTNRVSLIYILLTNEKSVDVYATEKMIISSVKYGFIRFAAMSIIFLSANKIATGAARKDNV